MTGTLFDIVMAVGVVASLVLHYFGKKHPAAEKVADEIDKAEDLAKSVKQ